MTDATIRLGRLSTPEILRAQRNVLAALILRDVKTRFGSAPGFLIAIAWPLTHILVLLGINVYFGRVHPYGESAVLWFAVSLTPFQIVAYVSRFMLKGLLNNRQLLGFPAINVIDILVSRVLIEIIVAACVVGSIVVILASLDVDFMPLDIPMAFGAFSSALMLGIGMGILNSIIAMMFPIWSTIFTLSLILLWLTSGAYFVPSTLNGTLQIYLSYHPMLHCIEWAREAWFSGYHSMLLDKAYVVTFGLFTICGGLVLERLMRGRVLRG